MSVPQYPGAIDEVLAEQRDYYEARAPEYDDWFFRRGRYDRGEDATRTWNDEVAQVRDALARESWHEGTTLEMAPGTGLWTTWLLGQGASLHVVDASPAMLAQLRQTLGARADRVVMSEGDLFSWRPERQFERAFVGFFISHVPRERLEEFFSTVAGALCRGGRIGFVDSLHEASSTATDHVLPTAHDEVMVRRLDDGREYRIVKNFYTPDELTDAARGAGLTLSVSTTPTYFIFGVGTKD